jgi:hypothetical protein
MTHKMMADEERLPFLFLPASRDGVQQIGEGYDAQ